MQITASCSIQSATTGFTAYIFPYRSRVSLKEAFEGLELGEGKPSRPVLRGPGGRKAAWLLGKPTSQTAKGPLCEIHFGERKFFAFSGTTKTDVVSYAVRESLASPDGAFITASLWCRAAQKGLRTPFFSTQSAATRFTAYIFPSLSRVFHKTAFEGLEPYTAKALRTVLRGLGPSNGAWPLGLKRQDFRREEVHPDQNVPV